MLLVEIVAVKLSPLFSVWLARLEHVPATPAE
jgi:hypothetical protein